MPLTTAEEEEEMLPTLKRKRSAVAEEGEEEMPLTTAEEEEEMLPALKRKRSAVAEEGEEEMPLTTAEEEEEMLPALKRKRSAVAEEGDEMPPEKKAPEEEEHDKDDGEGTGGTAVPMRPHGDHGDGLGLPRLDFDSLSDISYSSYPSTAADNDSDDDPEDFTEEGLKATDAVLSVSKSVVSLAASIDGDTFSCTGTVVYHHDDSATWIMTSAALIRKHGSDTEVHDASIMKIEVLLHSKKVVNGRLLMYDLHYNIAIVSIEFKADLPAVKLADLPGSYFLTPSPVVAIARNFESQSLQMKRGKTFRGVSDLDCNELMISTCQIKQIFVGGLLMDLEKRIVGMNFMDEETTPFLPVEVVGRCLTHFKMFREIKQPWLGIRGRALHLLELAKLEEIFHECPKPRSGILVDMIPEASCSNCVGVEAGDILNQLDGVVLHSPGQLTAMLLDKMELAMQMQKPVVLKALIHRPRDGTTFDADLKVGERPPGECGALFKNRWTRPKPNLDFELWSMEPKFISVQTNSAL